MDRLQAIGWFVSLAALTVPIAAAVVKAIRAEIEGGGGGSNGHQVLARLEEATAPESDPDDPVRAKP